VSGSRRDLLRGAASLAAVGAGGLLLSACAAEPGALPREVRSMLADLGIRARTVQEAVQALDAHPGPRPLALMASVQADRVVFDPEGRAIEAALPEDLFSLALAPFRTHTHDCFFHSLGGCQGELADTSVRVEIVDEGGTVLVQEETTTGANGFAGFWLPRDVAGTITAAIGEETGSIPFATTADAPTCLTGLQLS